MGNQASVVQDGGITNGAASYFSPAASKSNRDLHSHRTSGSAGRSTLFQTNPHDLGLCSDKPTSASSGTSSPAELDGSSSSTNNSVILPERVVENLHIEDNNFASTTEPPPPSGLHGLMLGMSMGSGLNGRSSPTDMSANLSKRLAEIDALEERVRAMIRVSVMKTELRFSPESKRRRTNLRSK